MREYLKSIVPQLKSFSESLDKASILVDKPWAMIDGEFELQKLIFKRNKELVLSKNGQVTMGKWEYFPTAKSLLIDRGGDKILCNEAFVNEGVMILKLDGTQDQFFILANENIIPDLNAIEYLRQLRYRKHKIQVHPLSDGRIVEITEGGDENIIGHTVFFEGITAPDGRYLFASNTAAISVVNGKVHTQFHYNEYKFKGGIQLIVEQRDFYELQSGDLVFLDGNPAPDGKYKQGLFGKVIKVRDGKIFY